MQKINKTKFKKAMEGSGGILANIARKLNVSRSAVTQFVQKHQDIQEMLKEEDESLTDLAEAKLIQKMKEGNLKAILARLESRRQAYSRKQEIKHSGEVTENKTLNVRFIGVEDVESDDDEK